MKTSAAPRLSTRETLLYHQVHPAKLAVDIGTAARSRVSLAAPAAWVHVWRLLAIGVGVILRGSSAKRRSQERASGELLRP